MNEPIRDAESAVREMGALPMPVGPERLTPQERDMILSLIGDAKPARSSLLVSFGESVRNRREHEHPQWEDFYCLNLSSYMGERTGPVLRRLVDAEAEIARLRIEFANAAAGVARLEKKRVELERIANAERARLAELEAPAAVQQRKGYEAAIAVMRQEKLPMSVGLLEAQLELNVLDGLTPEVTVYRASHDSIGMGLYTTADAAREHCETVIRRKIPGASLDWIEDQEDGVAELVASFGEDERPTGYVVFAAEVASRYDPDADE